MLQCLQKFSCFLAPVSQFAPTGTQRDLAPKLRSGTLDFDQSFEVRGYQSLIDLRQQWEELDHSGQATQLTVMLVLPEQFCGHLTSLISRDEPALRLILTATGQHLPGLETIGDLAASRGALGWYQIVFERSLREALRGLKQSLCGGDHTVIFWPEWQPGVAPVLEAFVESLGEQD